MTDRPRPEPLSHHGLTVAGPSSLELAQALRLVGEVLRAQAPADRFVRRDLRLPQL